MSSRRLYLFSEYVFDAVALTLSQDGRRVTVSHKALQLLRCLLENRGRVLSKDELMAAVWPETIVEEANLAQHVSTLRKALGERPGERRFIATVSGQGYAFVGSVNFHDGTQPATVAGRTVEPICVVMLPLIAPASRPNPTDVSDSLTKALISSLSAIPGLQVLSVCAGELPTPDIVSIYSGVQSLRAQYIIRGHLTCTPDHVSIVIQVIHGKTEAHVLADTCELPAGADSSQIRDRTAAVAHRIFAAIRVFESVRRSATPAPREVQMAHDLYLRGRFHQHTGQPEGLLRAIEYYEKAVARAPTHAGAYAGISDCYNILITIGRLRFDEFGPKMLNAAKRALEIDESLPDAHISLAAIAEFEYDWATAEYHYMRGLSLDNNNSQAHRWYGEYLVRMGRFGEALHELKLARDLDPFAKSANAVLGLGLAMCGRFDEAEEQFQYTMEMDPGYHRAYILLAMSRLRKRDHAGALATLRMAPNPDAETLGWLGYMMAITGNSDEASDIVARLLRLRDCEDAENVPAFSIASVYIGLRHADPAFEWLDHAYAERAFQLGFLQVDAIFSPIRTDARYQELLRKTNLASIPVCD